MKAYLILPLLSPFFLSSAYSQSESDYTNWIRQIQYEQNGQGSYVRIVRDNYVDKKGTGKSVIGIPENGALFQLWTMSNSDPSKVWKLDSSVVGAFGPKVTITITAEDSYAGQPRTRADRPFQVDYEVSGILANVNDSELPVDLSKVRSIHYTGGTASTGTSDEFLIFSDKTITENGTQQLSFTSTNISSEDPTQAHKVSGEETFVVESFTDIESEKLMDTKSIDIFAVPSGKIEGLTNNEILNALPSSLRIIVEDAYPGSEIYLEVIQYPNTPNKKTIMVEGTHRNTPNTQSENSDFMIDKFSDYTPALDSVVITRLVSKSIFGLEILAESTNSIDRALKVRGSINSL